ncbi:MAG: hypothetical protein ACXW1D_00105 [Halobacteriota archaeon]
MKNIYNQYASSLQSRLARRSRTITENEMWVKGYKALKRREQVKETKMFLKDLREQQAMDKKLLNLVQNMSWELEENDRLLVAMSIGDI